MTCSAGSIGGWLSFDDQGKASLAGCLPFRGDVLARAIAFGFVIVLTYAVIRWTSSGPYWIDFPLLVATVLGIGAVVAQARGEWPFLTAAIVSFTTSVCLDYLALFTGPAWARPEVLPPLVTTILLMVSLSLVIGAMTGAVALGLRSLRARPRAGR